MGLYYVLTMFRAKVLGSFSAAHSLREYRGDCERLHGHNYRVEVSVESDVQNATGLVMDFRDLKGLLKSAIRDDNPVIFIEHQHVYTSKDPVPEEEYTIPLGEGKIWREGSDITVVAYSHMRLVAEEAAAMRGVLMSCPRPA